MKWYWILGLLPFLCISVIQSPKIETATVLTQEQEKVFDWLIKEKDKLQTTLDYYGGKKEQALSQEDQDLFVNVETLIKAYTVVEEEGLEEIPKGDFVGEMVAWKKNIIQWLDEMPKNVRLNIDKLKATFPLNHPYVIIRERVYKDWKKVLDDFSSESDYIDSHEVWKAFEKKLDFIRLENYELLENYYKKGTIKYEKNRRENKTSFLDLLPNKDLFESLYNAAHDTSDPDTDENIAKANQLAKEKLDSIEKDRELSQAIAKWTEESAMHQTPLLVYTVKNNLLEKKKFLSKLESEFYNIYKNDYPDLSNIIYVTIYDGIDNIAEPIIEDVADWCSRAFLLVKDHLEVNCKTIYPRWKEQEELPSFEIITNIAFKANSEIEVNTLAKVYWTWRKDTAIGGLQERGQQEKWSDYQQFSLSKLKEKLKVAFGNGANEHTSFLCDFIINELSKQDGKTISYKTLLVVWGEIMDAITAEIAQHCTEVLSTTPYSKIRELVQTIALPNTTVLGDVFYHSRYFSPKPKEMRGDTFGIQFMFHDGTIFIADLFPKTKRLSKGMGLEISKIAGRIGTSGMLGYSLEVDSDSLYQQESQYNKAYDYVSTDIEFVLKGSKNRGSQSQQTGTVKGTEDGITGGYAYNKGSSRTDIEGTNTSHTTGKNVTTDKGKETVTTRDVIVEETEGETNNTTYTDETSGSLNLDLDIIEIGIGKSKGKNESEGGFSSTTETDHTKTVTTDIDKTTTEKVDIKTKEEVDLEENSTFSSHTFSLDIEHKDINLETKNETTTEELGDDNGALKIYLRVRTTYDSEKQATNVSVGFRAPRVDSQVIGALRLHKIAFINRDFVIK